jgi:hypothetical protein
VKKTIPTLLKLFMLCGFILLSAACSDDEDYTYPSVLTELVEATTNAEKNIAFIKRDGGETLYPGNQKITASAADSTYRCICTYEMLKDEKGKATQNVKLYKLQSIFSKFSVPHDQLKTHDHHPIQVISTWKSERYFNMYFGLLTTGAESHYMAFSQDSTVVSALGNKIMHVSLIHQQPKNDPESYTHKTYLSLPLYTMKDEADSLIFHVNTYNGEKQYEMNL